MEYTRYWEGERTVSIRKIVEEKNVSFMDLVETKHKKSLQNKIKRMWGNEEYDICEVYATDASWGGIIAVWDKNTFKASIKYTGSRCILLEGCINKLNFECCVGVIYG